MQECLHFIRTNKSVKISSMNIFLFCFLNLFFSYSLFGKNSEKEVVVNISNMSDIEKANFSSILLYIDDSNVSWNNVLIYLMKINSIGVKDISMGKNGDIINISSNGIEDDIKVVRYSVDKKTKINLKKEINIDSINHSIGQYVLIYWPINAWRNDCLRKISVIIFKTKINSLKYKKIGLNFCIDKNVSIGDVFCYLSVLSQHRNCVGIVFSYNFIFNPEYYQLSPNISSELP